MPIIHTTPPHLTDIILFVLGQSPELATRFKEAFKRLGVTRDYQLHRIQFALGESVRKTLFDEIKGYNDRLRNLLEISDAVSQAQSARNAARQTRERSAACGFWRHADQLYSLLSKAWNCSCWQQHHAHLLLQNRHRPSSPEADFQLILWSHSPHLLHDASLASWFCRPTRVEILAESEAAIPLRIAPGPEHHTSRIATPLHRTAMPLKPATASGTQQLRAKSKGPLGYVLVHFSASPLSNTKTGYRPSPSPSSRTSHPPKPGPPNPPTDPKLARSQASVPPSASAPSPSAATATSRPATNDTTSTRPTLPLQSPQSTTTQRPSSP